jgi:glycosyltransferase involved in cell wall biosynthesis
MNVMHQVNNLAIGGVETMVYRLCKYANEPTYVFAHQEGIVMDWIEEVGTRVYLKEDFDIFELIEHLKIDVFVMHTGSYLPEYAAEIKRRFPKIKMIVVLHTLYKLKEDWVDKIICVSRKIYELNDPAKSVLIYPGVDGRKRFVVGEVTRLAPYKYLEDFLILARAVLNYHPEVVFRIIGEEASDAVGYKEKLEGIVKESGMENSVIFAGQVDKIDYNEFDAFVHLVGNEAYPVTILEALKSSLLTLTYPAVGTNEMFHPLLIRSPNLAELIQILCQYIDCYPKHSIKVADEYSEVYKL